jgi:hypothetical protein
MTGSVGILWGIPSSDRFWTILSDATQLADAEPYGDFLTHPRGHYDVWSKWQTLSATDLRKQGIPQVVLYREYEEFPRGRIVYQTNARHFIVYADRQLQRPDVVTDIANRFSRPEHLLFDPMRTIGPDKNCLIGNQFSDPLIRDRDEPNPSCHLLRTTPFWPLVKAVRLGRRQIGRNDRSQPEIVHRPAADRFRTYASHCFNVRASKSYATSDMGEVLIRGSDRALLEITPTLYPNGLERVLCLLPSTVRGPRPDAHARNFRHRLPLTPENYRRLVELFADRHAKDFFERAECIDDAVVRALHGLPRKLDNRDFDLVFAAKSARTRFADWSGRRIDVGGSDKPRHRWSLPTWKQIFQSERPSLTTIDALGVLSDDSRVDEATLRLSLLWNELAAKADQTPSAMLGMLDILNLRSDRSVEFEKFSHQIGRSIGLAAAKLEVAEGWRFLTALLAKLPGRQPPPSLASRIEGASLELTERSRQETLEFLETESASSRAASPLMLAGIANGLARNASGAGLLAMLSKISSDIGASLIGASNDFARQAVAEASSDPASLCRSGRSAGAPAVGGRSTIWSSKSIVPPAAEATISGRS